MSMRRVENQEPKNNMIIDTIGRYDLNLFSIEIFGCYFCSCSSRLFRMIWKVAHFFFVIWCAVFFCIYLQPKR